MTYFVGGAKLVAEEWSLDNLSNVAVVAKERTERETFIICLLTHSKKYYGTRTTK